MSIGRAPAVCAVRLEAGWRRAVLAALLFLGLGMAHAGPLDGASPAWKELSADQRSALGPLQGQWDQLSPDNRQKWLRVASRYDRMPAADRERMQTRMSEWARMSPQERGQARLRYQQAQRLTPEERQAKWAAYQALTPAERERLAGSGASSRDGTPASESRGPRKDTQKKSNLVAAPSNAAAPKAVAPAVVQARPGATTNLISKPNAVPPKHQPTGLPKIAASADYVDRSTLLPQRGPQGAVAHKAAASAADKDPKR